ncbi:hypothetical protein Pla123a_00730 [Posidoniimonas polymericola]|uniref:Uncharacterized protein n=1 Tax=Posidoniimonas polymericola TaxID=2528002 RepID=A0A5C5ZDP4_9BACT|nr:hypothetical protein [Posidoniimonas polymericola]TWT85266.1 hypothetical protein Pla123a_00730 [Posidoniimonas polymericola]
MASPSNALTYQGRPRTCGLRLSTVDVVVMAAATAGGVAGYSYTAGFSPFVPFVVFHFFLFCNVFRIPCRPELLWAGVFLIHTTVWLWLGTVSLPWLFALQSVFTFALLACELRRPTYHGVLSRRFNPRIDDYLAGGI